MSLNDPRWGNDNKSEDGPDGRRHAEQGPPDLEEIWRDVNRRLSGLFGRGGGGQGGGGSPVSGPMLGGGIGLVVLALVVLWLASGFFTVDASERAVVLRFGKQVDIVGEGLRWRLPYPFESHEKVNVSQVRTVEVGYGSTSNVREALMLTDDENIVNIRFAVQYTVTDAAAFLFSVRDPEESVRQAAETAMREIVGKSVMDFVLYEGKEQLARGSAALMQQILDRYQVGIRISTVTVQNAQPPEQVQDAFNDAVKAGQDRERSKNDGQAYANDVIPRARGAASRLLEEASGYAGNVVARAEGDASRFKQVYTEYAKAPEVMRNRMYLDAMQQIFSNTSKVLVDAKGNGNLLYLPLDKLMQAAGAPAPDSARQEATAPTASSAVPPANNDARSRDSLRSRGER